MDQMKIHKLLVNIFKESDEGTLTVRDTAVKALYYALADYTDWYVEQGITLPPDYASRPSDWNEALHQIVKAFKLLDGQLETDNKFTDEEENEVKEGLTLFGKYLFYLNDPIVDKGPAHG